MTETAEKLLDVRPAIAQQKIALTILQYDLMKMGYSPFDIAWKTDNWDNWDDEWPSPGEW